MNTKRLDWIDIAKGIAILLVIIGHTVSYESPIRHYIFSFHMPLFFILAGYTFRLKPWRETIISSAKRLLVPYILLCVVWFIPWLLASDSNPNGVLVRFFLCVFFASGDGIPSLGISETMLWFLMALFISKMLLSAVIAISNRTHAPLVVSGLFCLALGIGGIAVGSFEGMFLPLNFDVGCISCLFMWCGYAAKQKQLFVGQPRAVIVVVVAILWVLLTHVSYLEMATHRYDNPVCALLGALAGTCLVCFVAQYIEKGKDLAVLSLVERFLVWCGINSMTIFCIHAIDWYISWTTFAQVMNLPFANGIAAGVRVLCDVSFARVIKEA